MTTSTCTHCKTTVRPVGLQLVATDDDTAQCPEAPMETCTRCEGDGCGSCEGYGEIYGRHTAHRSKGLTVAKRPNPNPGPGENITTYTVDQLKEQAKRLGSDPEQMYEEIERRARLHDGEEDPLLRRRAMSAHDEQVLMSRDQVAEHLGIAPGPYAAPAQVKQEVTVEIGGVTLDGTISGFPSKKVEYATRPVIVKIGPAEYVTVDLTKVGAR